MAYLFNMRCVLLTAMMISCQIEPMLLLLLITSCLQARYVFNGRSKRNIYDPSFPSFPNPNIPMFQPWPYPVATPPPTPFDKFMPQPPKEYPNNPFLEHMDDGYNPNYGFGLSYLPGPALMGGSVHFPNDDLFEDKNTVSGTFVKSAGLQQVRMGTQGGALYPWMNRKYPDAIRAIDNIGRTGNFHPTSEMNELEHLSENWPHANDKTNVPYQQSGLPPLPPDSS